MKYLLFKHDKELFKINYTDESNRRKDYNRKLRRTIIYYFNITSK